MREIRQSGSEGGEAELNRPSLPLSIPPRERLRFQLSQSAGSFSPPLGVLIARSTAGSISGVSRTPGLMKSFTTVWNHLALSG